jgi:hypothetical protein
MPKTPSLSQLMKPPDTPGGFIGTVQPTVFSARHAGLWSGGMGTVSDDI